MEGSNFYRKVKSCCKTRQVDCIYMYKDNNGFKFACHYCSSNSKFSGHLNVVYDKSSLITTLLHHNVYSCNRTIIGDSEFIVQHRVVKPGFHNAHVYELMPLLMHPLLHVN